jgi:hypothetical protein
MADIALRRKYDRNELDDLKTKEMQRLDVLVLESLAKSQPRKQSHRVQARVEFILKNKTAGRLMSEAALTNAVIGVFGGAMYGIDGVLLAKDRHGEVDLRGNADTCFWVSDLGPETDTESQFVERLLTALSSSKEVPIVGDCFSSIRVKSGRPSLVQVAPVVETPPLTFDDVEQSIVTFLFHSGPAVLPAYTTSGQSIWEDQVWANGTSNVDLGPPESNDVRGICAKAPQSLVLQVLTQLLEHKIIVCYGPEPRPGGKAVIEFYHTLKNIYSCEVRPDDEIPAMDETASEGPIATMTSSRVGAGGATGNAGTELETLDAIGDAGADSDPGVGDATCDAGADTGVRDVTDYVGADPGSGAVCVDAGAEPGAGNAIGEAGTDSGAGDAIGDAGTEPRAGDAIAGASADSGPEDVIGDVGTAPGAGGVTDGSSTESGAGGAIGEASAELGAGTIGNAGTVPGVGDATGDAGADHGAWDATDYMDADPGSGALCVDAGAEPGAGDATGGATHTWDAIGEAGTDPGAGEVIDVAGTAPGAGDATAGASAESGPGDVIGESGAEPGAGDATGGASAESGPGDVIGEAGADPGAGAAIVVDVCAEQDATVDTGTKTGMGVIFGAAVTEPVQVCERSQLVAARDTLQHNYHRR